MKTETGKREAAINNLKAEISEKEKQLKEVHIRGLFIKYVDFLNNSNYFMIIE